MKSICLFVPVMILIALADNSHSGIIKGYGVQVGIVSASQNFKGEAFPMADESLKRRIGFVAGAYLEWLNLPYISAVTEIEYMQKGMGMEVVVTGQAGPEPLGKYTDYSRLDYLSVPVYGKISLPAGIGTPYFIAGPRFDYLLDYNSEFLGIIYNEFRKTAWGGMVGVGFAPHLSILIKSSVELRYNFDFTDSYKPAGREAKNNTFDVRVGIPF